MTVPSTRLVLESKLANSHNRIGVIEDLDDRRHNAGNM